jgi:serine/threonine-protein kinase
MIGTSVNQYRITAALGAGGMGEVFRARDTRLNRDVAIKMLPKEFVSDADRLRRFEQEAKTLAALNHPNVLTIHDAGVHEGAPYLVSELLEGRTLREEMKAGALAVRKATEFALQIAHGLAAAHSKGVIHRDLKPENIFVTKDGRAKILDFGLAKLKDPSPRPSPLGGERVPEGRVRGGVADAAASTVVQPAAESTEPGKVMGTPSYMSPEQVRGEPADHRADIFAFGCVLYEMLSGTRAFRRDTPIASMNAVLSEEPPGLNTSDSSILPALERVVRRCLEKHPDNRFQSAKDLAFALEESSSAQNAPQRARATSRPADWRMLAAGVAVLAVVLGAWWVFRPAPQSQPSSSGPPSPSTPADRLDKSVAVLPFANLSPDKADEYLSDGITEELLQALAKVKGLRVPGRSSSFAFKGRSEENLHRKVGEQLKVGAVLEGSVRKAGERLRVTAQLTSVAEGFSLWSETYERDMTNIFAIQSEIASRVAQALRVELLGETAPLKAPTENLEAYKLYLQGRQLWNRRTGPAISEAITHFTQAIALAPAFALAHAALADAYVILGDYAGLPDAETQPKARTAAQRALELDPTLAEPRAALAQIRAYYEWDWVAGEAEFRRAIEMNPNYATSHHWLGNLLMTQGRKVEALVQWQRGLEIDPLSLILQSNVARGLFETGREEAGVAMLQELAALHPDFPPGQYNLGELWLRHGRYSEAVEALEAAHRLSPDNKLAEGFLGLAYVRAGRIREAQQALDRLLDRERSGRDFNVSIALVYHALGNDTEALKWLEQAAEQRSGWLEELYTSPHWDALRSHPRAQAILRKMNLVK